jgi:hypothetical protein
MALSIHCARVLVAGDVARPINQIKHLSSVGQRHDQRRVPPHALVGDVDALLALPAGRGIGAIDVDIGDRAEQVAAPPGPQPRPDRVDRLQQPGNVRFGEPAAEVPGRGRIRDQIRPQRVHVRRVVAQPFDVLQPGAATHHVVGQVQHVIGLVVGQVHLQQPQALVDLLG